MMEKRIKLNRIIKKSKQDTAFVWIQWASILNIAPEKNNLSYLKFQKRIYMLMYNNEFYATEMVSVVCIPLCSSA